jgi:predicted SnoaL-like aldol condensation-catalyzing enzyme
VSEKLTLLASELENKAIAYLFYEEVWNRGNLAVAEELIATGFVYREAESKTLGREGYKRYVSKVRAAC